MAQIIPEVAPHFAKPWQLLVSVCLTRMNRITRELSDIEIRYANMQSELEVEESVYNDYEHTKKQLQLLTAEKSYFLSDEKEIKVLEASRKLADIEDQEEAWLADFNKIEVASRNVGNDSGNNTNSLDRQLDRIVHCVINDQSLLQENTTLYPYTAVETGESLRTATERLLSSHKLKESAIFYSNAPVGVLKLRFNKTEERGALYQGAKIFFMKAHIHKLPETPTENVEWLTLEELGECSNEEYFKRIKPFIV